MSTKAVLAAAASSLASRLKPLGYRRSGFRFVRPGPEVVSLIELQTRRGSTSTASAFVINYGVVVVALAEGSDHARPMYTDCHWGGRVSDEKDVERWWEVRDGDSPEELALRVWGALEADVLVDMNSKQTEAALIELWQTGRSPLLAEAQRLLFLGLLLCRSGRKEDLAMVRSELEVKARDAFALRALSKLRSLEC